MDSSDILKCAMVGSIFGCLAILISWLLRAESSPFYEFFLHNVSLPNLWGILNFPAFMVLILVGGRSFAAGLIVVFTQWFVIGIVGSLVIQKLRKVAQ